MPTAELDPEAGGDIMPHGSDAEQAAARKADLRQRAEALVVADEGDGASPLSPVEASTLLHELRVHQIELEMQNEELRRSHAALEASKDRYFDLFDLAPIGYLTLGESDLLLEVNLAAATLMGATRSVLVKQAFSRYLLHQDQGVWHLARKALLETGARQVCELRLRGQGAAPIWVRLEVTAARDPEGATVLRAAMNDVTARVEAQQRLAHERAQVQELNRSLTQRVQASVADLRAKDQLLATQGRQAAMGEMVGNIAHQWRQPLNALALVLANLRDESRAGELDGSTVETAVDDSQRLIQKMSATITDFSNFITPRKEKHTFSALAQARETLRLMDATFADIGIALELEGESDPSLRGFPNEYSQVLLNLLGNAREAIQSSKVAQGRVTVWVGEREGLACTAVRDNGGGVPEALLGQIFEPYFSTRPGGTGIGLYMSRQLVERSLGGRLEVRNLESGAEFSLLAPLAPMDG